MPVSARGQAAPPDLSYDAFVSATKEKVLLTQAEETCLASLFCRIQDAQSPHPVLGDVYARKTLDRCEVDQGRTTFTAVQQVGIVKWVCHRALTLDKWCEEFILAHDQPVTVVHLACGLDCRYLRLRDRLRGIKSKPDVRVSQSFSSPCRSTGH